METVFSIATGLEAEEALSVDLVFEMILGRSTAGVMRMYLSWSVLTRSRMNIIRLFSMRIGLE